MKERWTGVEAFFDGLFAAGDPDVAAAERASAEAGLPAIQVSPDLGRFLHLLVRIRGAERILEVGTLGGVSALWLADAQSASGRVVTLELDPHHAEVARGNLEAAGVGSRVEVRVGDAADSLRALKQEGAEPFDLVFLDADKQGYPRYLELSLELCRPGSLIVADNVVRDGKVLDADSEDPSVRGTRQFLIDAAAHPRLEGMAMQTVGSKGYDGVAVFRVVAS